MENNLPTPYQEFIHLSRYARWLPEEKRRETWEETVDRLVNFFEEHLKENFDFELGKAKNRLRKGILNLQVVPSMRALWAAGPAASRDNVACYNCSALPIDKPASFDELFYILMNGCGVGFSVERQFINKLPEVSDSFHESDTTIVVSDSTIGWCKALKELIGMLYVGQVPRWDLSKIRPAGTPLKTKGGRASGGEILGQLFDFVVVTFKGASGRKLNSLECHDICCKIAEIVTVGGCRRSALLSLSNLSDLRMREAKVGRWWEESAQRAMANNSVAYTEKPDMGIFMEEWKSLYDSKSGERGIFNRESCKKIIEKIGRRDTDFEFLTNPCVTSDTWIDTSEGPIQAFNLINKPFLATVNGKNYECKTGFFKTGHKDVYEIETSRGYSIKCTSDHKILTIKEGQELWVEAQHLDESSNICINQLVHQDDYDLDLNEFHQGWLMGEVAGDGGHNPEKYPSYVRFWGHNRHQMSSMAHDFVKDLPYDSHRPTALADDPTDNGTYSQSASRALDELLEGMLEPETKNILPALEGASDSTVRGFLRGIFDADGTVLFNKEKGRSVRLGQNNLDRLKSVQRMLHRFGIESSVYQNRKPEGYYEMPDGKGGNKEYFCKAMHELAISRENICKFAELINFYDADKKTKLTECIDSLSRTPYKDKMTTNFVSRRHIGQQDVYDCTVDEVHRFGANGIIIHNCSEILLRPRGFCNLSEVILREDDTEETILEKIELATILGTIQSTFTNFRYLSKNWKKNADEERLLGVSMTGIMDCPLTNDSVEGLEGRLERFKERAIEVNKKWAKSIGINQSAAITCVKPSGNTSQLCDTASGIHTRHSPYYIRTVRSDKKDPLTKLMIDKGFPYEDEINNPQNIAVFSFPIKAPEQSFFRNDKTALEQLELWKKYQLHYCEHKPSITVSVKEDEWLEVGAWVYKNFDLMSGVSFLPFSDHVYKQAPYQDCTKEQYEELLAKMPKTIDWSELSAYESSDMTTGARELACTAGGCEI